MKKIIKSLICLLVAVSVLNGVNTKISASTYYFTKNKTLGVDVSDVKEQANLDEYADLNAEFVVIRTSRYRSDGSRYGSDNARKQVASAKENNMHILAYHAANFSNSVSRAKEEAKYAVEKAKKYGINEGAYLACDYELNASNNRYQNTRAVIAFMSTVAQYGYKPLLYTGMKYVNEYLYTDMIVDNFGRCLWIANYAKLGAVEEPNMKALKKLGVKGVLMYQFTNDWYGKDVDCNINVAPLFSK